MYTYKYILKSMYYVRKCHRQLFISLSFEKLKLLSLKFNYLPLKYKVYSAENVYICIYIYPTIYCI